MASDQPKADIIMTFRRNGRAIPAEGVVECDPKIDDFVKGFESAPYQNYSNFFEVQKFTFGVGLEEDDTSTGKLSHGTLGSAHHAPKQQSKVHGAWSNWRTLSEKHIREQMNDPKKLKYPLEPDTFSFTRLIDAASPNFLKGCIHSWNYDSAILVKRVSATYARGQPPRQLGYFRIEFTDVLVTGVDWDDGDFVNETCKFICKKFSVQYKTQNADGTLVQKGQREAKWLQPAGEDSPRTGGR